MRALGAFLLAFVLAAGCSMLPDSLAPGTPAACMAALVSGELVGIPPDRLGLVSDGVRYEIDWSDAFEVRQGEPIELVDRDGVVVARAGDQVTMGGGEARPGVWSECGVTVKVRAP